MAGTHVAFARVKRAPCVEAKQFADRYNII